MKLLNDKELESFFKLYFELLVWVNNKYDIVSDFTKEKNPKSVDSTMAYTIREKMFQNPTWIDEYLADDDSGELTEIERGIVLSWRRDFISGKFFVMRHLAKYSVFMSEEEDARLYGVSGLTNSFEDFYDRSELPIIVKATILPFMDKITYDGMFIAHNINIGPGMRRNLNECYRISKEKFGIIERLPFDETVSVKKPPTAVKTAQKKPASQTNERVEEIKTIIIKFCSEKLEEDFIAPCLYALERLRRKRPSPLLGGKINTWACGIVYAIASNNFVFDIEQPYYMSAQDMADGFGLSKTTAQNKAREIRRMLDINYFSIEYVIADLQNGGIFDMLKTLEPLEW